MSHILQFGEVLEAADHLSAEEQEELIAILQRRMAHAARQRLVAEVEEARKEFAEGRCLPTTPEDLMREAVSLGTNPKFIDLIERSRARVRSEGTVSSEEMRRRFE